MTALDMTSEHQGMTVANIALTQSDPTKRNDGPQDDGKSSYDQRIYDLLRALSSICRPTEPLSVAQACKQISD